MKIAIIYNRESKNVINLFGLPNRERYGKKAIKAITDGLKKYKHQVRSFEGDKDLVRNLEEFMPRVLKGERPGMVFNLSYGVQGQARYTHVPGILEMVGIPYVGSGPLAHSLALDKVVAKIIFRQNGLPTPDFAVLNDRDFEAPQLPYPLIVKPKNEAVSMGIRIVNTEDELREAAQIIFGQFEQAVLVEQYIEGREVNVGLLGNNPPEAFPPCEIVFGDRGPAIYTIEDKEGRSGREIQWLCPAPISEELTEKAKGIAIRAFSALGCYDCARVDMRMDADGNLYILEINSLPSLGEHGSYTIAAREVGLNFSELVYRLVETASARYFGTPKPPEIVKEEKDIQKALFSFITERRDHIERSLEDWTACSSRTFDPVGQKMAMEKLDNQLKEIKMRRVSEFSNDHSCWTWESRSGFKGGTLFIGHMDVPLEPGVPTQLFRREPEWLYGEGIGISRAPLVMLEYALRALRSQRCLQKLPLGVLYYRDEGRDAVYSAGIIKEAASRAQRVFILGPGGPLNSLVVQRRGRRKYRLTIEGKPKRLGRMDKEPEVLLWSMEKIKAISALSSRKDRTAMSAVDIKVDTFPGLLPHRMTATLLLSYLDKKKADDIEDRIKILLKGGKFKIA
ncbi:MAG: ATP-grasp domain-containing protein, partial [Thermodesulfobacteriota bacterium]|nr:ATP-grasp domain-containing protein [Thermodesulfobacteriota bacterium]